MPLTFTFGEEDWELDFIVYVILGLACGRARLDHGVLLGPCRLPSHSRYRWVFSRGLLGASSHSRYRWVSSRGPLGAWLCFLDSDVHGR